MASAMGGEPMLHDDRLPDGWRRNVIQRKEGASAGKWDVYIYSPSGKKFRSRTDLAKYFDNNDVTALKAIDFDFSVRGLSNPATPKPIKKKKSPAKSTPKKPADSPKKKEKTPIMSLSQKLVVKMNFPGPGRKRTRSVEPKAACTPPSKKAKLNKSTSAASLKKNAKSPKPTLKVDIAAAKKAAAKEAKTPTKSPGKSSKSPSKAAKSPKSASKSPSKTPSKSVQSPSKSPKKGLVNNVKTPKSPTSPSVSLRKTPSKSPAHSPTKSVKSPLNSPRRAPKTPELPKTPRTPKSPLKPLNPNSPAVLDHSYSSPPREKDSPFSKSFSDASLKSPKRTPRRSLSSGSQSPKTPLRENASGATGGRSPAAGKYTTLKSPARSPRRSDSGGRRNSESTSATG